MESGKQGVWIPEGDSHFSNQEIVPFGNFLKMTFVNENDIFCWKIH